MISNSEMGANEKPDLSNVEFSRVGSSPRIEKLKFAAHVTFVSPTCKNRSRGEQGRQKY
jgi:hypothetical protein